MLDKRLVIVSGKGGVGKSAFVAGLALLAQRQGLRVLAVETESGGGMAAHLSSPQLEFRPREVRPGLHAMEMVRSEALLEYLSLQLHLPGMGRFGAVARAFDALATAAPAVREIVTIGKVLWEVREDRWDLVVFDAPPTGQIGSFLSAPNSISELVPSGRISGQAKWMAETLADPDITQLVLVTLAEELPTAETKETIAWVDRSGVVARPLVVANRVLTPVAASVPIDRVDGFARDMANLHQSLCDEQEHWLRELPPDLTLPYLFGVFTPPEVAVLMSDLLETKG